MQLSGVNSERIAATGLVLSSDLMSALCGVSLTAGADAATLTIRDGSASGKILLEVKAAAGDTEDAPVNCPIAVNEGDVHLTFTGTSPSATVQWK